MLFIGGPPTIGPGAMASVEKSVPMRSHTDIEKGDTPLMKAAMQHYEGLARRAVRNCHV